jgi:hypothetical protein
MCVQWKVAKARGVVIKGSIQRLSGYMILGYRLGIHGLRFTLLLGSSGCFQSWYLDMAV